MNTLESALVDPKQYSKRTNIWGFKYAQGCLVLPVVCELKLNLIFIIYMRKRYIHLDCVPGT